MAKKSRYKKKRNPVLALLDGLLTLLDRLLEASGQEANLYEMIEKHGLVV